MTDYRAIFSAITSDPRYLANIEWGMPRPGHPEGTIRAHIAELEGNLARLHSRVSDEEHWKLRLLIHTHDTFKPEAIDGVGVGDPRHHGSIAAEFLERFLTDPTMLAIARLHDEPYAIWHRARNTGSPNAERLGRLLAHSWDWDLFAAFLIIDGSTVGKSSDPLRWILGVLKDQSRITRFGPEDAP